MVSYEMFEKTIKGIIKYNEWCNKIEGLQINLIDSPAYSIISITTCLLEEQMDDREGFISWWMWECDFGKNEPYVCIADEKGEKMLTIDTISKLYELIVEEAKVNDKKCDNGV